MTIDTSDGHEAMDYAEHERTYRVFVKGAIWLTAACLVILALLALFVA